MSELAPGQPQRLLLVEDDAEVRGALEELLKMEGFETLTASNGAEALRLLLQGSRVDLILLDLMMPVMDGWEFRLEQRRTPVLAQIPVVALSADASAKAAAIDADGYVRKPYAFPVLMTAIDAALRKARARRIAQADRMSALGTLAAGIAHEINNPLSFVIANLQYLEERLSAPDADKNSDPAEIKAVLREALEGAERIRRVVRDVKTFARADEETRVPVDVPEMLETCLGVVANELRHCARVVRDLEPVPPVLATHAWLSQVFVQLLVNAAHAIPEGNAAGNEVRVSTRLQAEGKVAVEIKDTGRGIPLELRHRVFDPFFTTRAVGAGSGLGLSIVHGIVSALGGELSLVSEVGKGTTVRVLLPAATQQQQSPQAPYATPATPSKLLIVEDEPTLARAFQRMLRSGHEVTVALSGREALDLLRSGKSFDAILCDLLMPEMTGMDLYDEIHRSFPGLERRMIFMTGGAFTQRAREFLEGLTNPHLTKPFDLQGVLGALQRLPNSA